MTTWTIDSATSPPIPSDNIPTAITDAGPTTIVALSGAFVIRRTVPQATTITWFAGVTSLWFKDGAGNAGTYQQTLVPPNGYTIDGQPTYILAFDWQSVALVLDVGTVNYLVY